MKQGLPDVDIVLVNYNGIKYIDACLASLFASSYPGMHIIMVDNNSTDGSVALVREKYPSVRILDNKHNAGFGVACNQGVRAGTSPVIAFLNNDTVVEENWLTPLMETLQESKNTVSVCSKLLFLSNRKVVNGSGGGMNYLSYGYDIGMFDIDNGRYEEVTEVFFPCAAACVIRRSAFEEVGGFDERFFMYHEDVDLGWRLRLRGYDIKCNPRSRVYHAFGGTSLAMGSMAFRNNLGYRHALRGLIKNYEPESLAKVLPTFLLAGFKHGIKDRSFTFTRNFLWNLTVLGDTLKERREIQKNRTVQDRELSAHIWPEDRLPVWYPDYPALSLQSFVESNNRRSSLDFTLERWRHLGYGWHGMEMFHGEEGGFPYRWTKEEAVFYLWNPYVKGDGTELPELKLEILGLAKAIGRNREVEIAINGATFHRFTITSDEWQTVCITCPDTPAGPLEITIGPEDAWRPDDVFHNRDYRLLGIGLRRAEVLPAKAAVKPLDKASVIIPSYNRVRTLLHTLQALEAQTLPRGAFEVIVVDDGSTDGTQEAVHTFMANTTLDVKYFKQPNKKQGAARNLGITHAKNPLLVFIGDDIIPEPSFLAQHCSFHQERNLSGKVVCIGYTKWPRELTVTPFMRFIGQYGYQFGYSLIEENTCLPFNFFYTSNISLAKSFLEGLENVFDEAFDTYGWEDVELGYRLESIGMRLLYHKSAVASHYHDIDIPSFCRRQRNVGKASRIFLNKHPELTWLLGNPDSKGALVRMPLAMQFLEKALHIIDKKLLLPVPHRLYKMLLDTHYAFGAASREKNS